MRACRYSLCCWTRGQAGKSWSQCSIELTMRLLQGTRLPEKPLQCSTLPPPMMQFAGVNEFKPRHAPEKAFELAKPTPHIQSHALEVHWLVPCSSTAYTCEGVLHMMMVAVMTAITMGLIMNMMTVLPTASSTVVINNSNIQLCHPCRAFVLVPGSGFSSCCPHCFGVLFSPRLHTTRGMQKQR